MAVVGTIARRTGWRLNGVRGMPASSICLRRCLWLCSALLFGAGRLAHGQIYGFEQEAVPANRSLHTLYAFYVYSLDEAPDRSQGFPFVKFKGLEATSTSLTYSNADLSNKYHGIQLSIMRFRDFWNLIDPKKFCSTEADVQAGSSESRDQLLVRKPVGDSYADVDVYIHTIHFPNASVAGLAKDSKERKVRKSGVYILVFSNCGDFSEATVSGTVLVKNAYGFLPGNEYNKMPFYGRLLLWYGFLATVWFSLSIRWWKELFNIQLCVGVVIFFGLIESFLWYIFFQEWNNTGTRGKFLFILAILFTVVKSTFSYMLVLVASLGWGVTLPYLDHQVILKIQVLCFLYIVLDFVREAVLSFRNSHSLSLAFVLLCLLPVSLLNGVFFYWVFTALSSLMEKLKERRQVEKLLMFQRLWKILIFTLAVATFTLLFQIFNLSRSISERWTYQWLLTDGVSHILFTFVLIAIMYLWAPHRYSQRYAYSTQVVDVETSDKPTHSGAVWVDEDDDMDHDEESSFWAATHGGEGGDGGEEVGTMPAGGTAGSNSNGARTRADVIGNADKS